MKIIIPIIQILAAFYIGLIFLDIIPAKTKLNHIEKIAYLKKYKIQVLIGCILIIVYSILILCFDDINPYNKPSNLMKAKTEASSMQKYEITAEIIESNIKSSKVLQSIDRAKAEDFVICVYTNFINNSDSVQIQKCFYGRPDETYVLLEPYIVMCSNKYGIK